MWERASVYWQWTWLRDSRSVHPPAKTREQAGLDRRARLLIAACLVLPVLLGVIVTAGAFRAEPAPPPPMAGHWVYVPSLGAAVHVDGGNKKVDATVRVGSAGDDSLVVQNQHAAYVVNADGMIEFTRTAGVTGKQPSPGVSETPVPVQAAGAAYLVYRAAGMIVPLGGEPINVGGQLGAPVMTPAGQLWVNRVDTGQVCVLEKSLTCNATMPHPGALTLLDDKPVFVDTTTSTWQSLTDGTRPTKLRVDLPDNAIVGGSSVDGRIPVIDPAAKGLLLVAASGGVIRVPLPPGAYDRPYTAGGAIEVADRKTGAITTFDGSGTKIAERFLGGPVRVTKGDDDRVYTDTADGLQSVVMDGNGALTPVPTSDQVVPTYHSAPPTTSVSLAPANVTPTTTETIPAAPDTVTVEVTPTSGAGGSGGAGGADAAGGTSSKSKKPTSTKPLPGAPPGSPVVDVLSATALGDGKARVHLSVHGTGPVFCHVFFNSVERAAVPCSGVMDVTATGIPPHQLYDIYVLGVNDKGTGNPGRREQLAM